MTSIAIYQPNFIPWLNFFRRLNKVDKFVFLDHVNFQKNGLQNRNKIFVNNKETWLTIPVKKELNISQQVLIRTVLIINNVEDLSLINITNNTLKISP